MVNKKILYVCAEEFKPSNGIAKKISQQVAAFNRLGCHVDIISREGYDLTLNFEKIYKKKSSKIIRVLYFYYLRKAFDLNIISAYSVLYIRNPDWMLSVGLIGFIKKYKSNVKVIIEIPTYPYDYEAKSIKTKISLCVHKMQRRKFSKYIHLIVYMGDYFEYIWGVKALRIGNGYDTSAVPEVSSIYQKDNSFNFIGVARLAYWHGYDRLIEGIYNYFLNGGKYEIKFFVIGEGARELIRLKKMVKMLSIEDKVIFFGPLYGDRLDEIYNQANVGVDSIGRHRSGNNYNSSLKSKEYLSRGLPIIKSHYDDDIDSLIYCYNISQDDKPVNISDIIQWYKSLNIKSSDIREFAKNNFSWDKYINNVLLAIT